MEKMTYIMVAATVVLVALAVGAVVYGSGVLNSGNGPLTDTTPGQKDVTSPITAMQAMNIAENDANVLRWKAGKQDTYLTRVSADSCKDGLSFIWIITYGSGKEELSAQVMDVAVSRINTTVLVNDNRYEKIGTAGMIDSDKAANVAVEYMSNDGHMPSGPGSIELWAGAQGSPVWDIRYPFEGGYYIFRIDAVSGKLIRGALFNTG